MDTKRTRDARPPGPITEDYVMRAAAHYLQRYASSAANLRRVLERKVARRAMLRGESAEGFLPLVERTVARFVELKLLDDESYAQARVASLRRRGGSKRAIEARLAAKGVDRALVAASLDGEGASEAEAAANYARRRRLGVFRDRAHDKAEERDLAAMLRAGFSFGDARRALAGGAPEDDDADPPA